MLMTKTLLASLLASLNLLCLLPERIPSLSFDQKVTEMSAAEFHTYGQLAAVLENFDFDARCEVSQFRLVRVAKRSDPVMIENLGSNFTTNSKQLIQQARSGDVYFFEEIKARCPEDPAARPLAGLVVKIL